MSHYLFRCCKTVLLWSSWNVLWTAKLHPALHPHADELIMNELSFCGEHIPLNLLLLVLLLLYPSFRVPSSTLSQYQYPLFHPHLPPTNVASSFLPCCPRPCTLLSNPFISLSSCPSAQPPTCHLDLRAMGHSCRICVTSMHTYTQTKAHIHTHTHTWLSGAASLDCNQRGLSCRSGHLFSEGWRHQSALQRQWQGVSGCFVCVCVCVCLWNIWGHIWNLNQLIGDRLSNWGQNRCPQFVFFQCSCNRCELKQLQFCR